jgi:2-iminobutanoate/2-iminopropanoate deaminase
MSKKAITCNTAPSAIGTYSQAISAGNLVFISGQIPLNYKDMNVIKGTFDEQVETVLNNIKNIASDAECTLNDCVKFTVYLKDIENFASVNAVMDKHLEKPYPARAAVEVSRLPKDVEVEIDAILYKK